MNKKIVILIANLIVMLIPFGINSQLSLTQQFGLGGASGFTQFFDITHGSDGFIYLMSSTTANGVNGNINVSPYGLSYIVVTKLDSNLEIIWQHSYGGNGDESGFIQGLSDGLLIAATSSSGISGNKTVDNYGVSDGWLFKIDFDGNIIWQHGVGGSEYDEILDIKVSPDEVDIYLGFRSYSSTSGNRTAPLKGDRDYWIVKLNSMGDIVWDYSYGSDGDDAIRGLTQLANGNIVAAGSSLNGNVSFDKTEPPYSFMDSWLVCIDPLGTVVWDKTIGGDGGELDGFLAVDENEIFLLSTSTSGVSGLRTEPLKGQWDLWVTKLDENGNIIWMNYYGGDDFDRATSVYINDNMLFINSYSTSNSSFDKTEDTKGGQDYWMIVTDLNGEIIVDKTIGGSLNDVSPKTIFYGDKILLAGSSYSDVSGDKTFPRFNPDLNETEVWLVELDASTLEIIQSSSISPKVYPNPVTDYLTINLSEFASVSKVDIFDYQGKLLLSRDLSNTPNPTTMQIDMSGFSSGMYTVRVYGDNVVRAVKVVK